MSRFSLSSLACCGLVVALGGGVGGSSAAAATLRACLLDEDLPRAQRSSGSGFDLAVLRAVAAENGLELEPVWMASREGFSEIESTDLPLDEVATGQCDVIASVPGEVALARHRSALALTRPYYGAGFELVTDPRRPGRPTRIEDVASDQVVAVMLQSLGHFAAEGLGITWQARPTVAEVLALVDDGSAGAALVWGPSLARFGRTPVSGWEPPAGLRFNEHLAMRRDDTRREAIDRTLAALLDSGRIAELARAAGLVYHPPFATVSSREALRALRIGSRRSN